MSTTNEAKEDKIEKEFTEIGKIIHQRVMEYKKREGISLTELTNRLPFSRQTMYNVYSQANPDETKIIQLGKMIGWDFSIDFKMNSTYELENESPTTTNEPNNRYERMDYWKDKYIEMLEKHNRLISEEQKSSFTSLIKSINDVGKVLEQINETIAPIPSEKRKNKEIES